MFDAADISRVQSGGWLSRQPQVFCRALIEIIVWRHVDAGETIYPAGGETGGIWGIAKGQVDVTSALGAADSPIADIYLPGRWGGIAPVFGLPRGGDATTRIPSLIAFTPLPRIHTMLQQHPEWWHCFGQLALEFGFRYGGATGDLLIRDSRRRCIAVLLRLADCRGGDPEAPPSIILNHADLAAAANMSRHPAGEVLRELDALGYIDLGYRQLTILNAPALRAIVDG